MDGTVSDGQASWVDLSTADIGAAQHFYGELFGWALKTNNTPMGDYVVGSVGDREVAGMMAQTSEMTGSPSVWTVYFYVDDLDAATAEISTAGGTVLRPPFDLPDGTRVAVAADPEGAMFALISGKPQPGPYLSPTAGAVSWVELMTRRPVGAEGFYNTVFGWTAETADADGTAYTVFGRDNVQTGGMIETPAHLPDEVPDTWSAYFNVGDCAATEELAKDLGGQVILPSTDTPMGPFAVLADPQGAVFQIMQFTETREAAATETAESTS